jgi:pimeloyl-ACP methyl ester carboxylesterase
MQHLLLLHGAIGAKSQFGSLAKALSNEFNIHLINFSGHGGKPITEANFSIALFAGEVLDYMEENRIERADIFGYSMGGYVAMYIARYHPARANHIITLATKFHWDQAIAAKEVKMLNAETIQQKVPAFAQQLSERHFPTDWKRLLEKTAELLTTLGDDNTLKHEDYLTVTAPCLLLLGDRDKMVTLDETVTVYKQLPDAQLGILPGTSHQLELVNLQLLVFLIKQFLSER